MAELTDQHIQALIEFAEKAPSLLKQIEMVLAKKSPEEIEWITKDEARALLRGGNGAPCSERTLARLVANLQIVTNGNRPGRTPRYSKSSIMKYIANPDGRYGKNQ